MVSLALVSDPWARLKVGIVQFACYLSCVAEAGHVTRVCAEQASRLNSPARRTRPVEFGASVVVTKRAGPGEQRTRESSHVFGLSASYRVELGMI